jgi:hypothetical protein
MLHLVRSEDVSRSKDCVGPVRPNLVCIIKPMVVPQSGCESGQVA